MANDQEENGNQSKKKNTIIVRLEMSPETAKQFEKAYADGRFDDLGIIDLRRVDTEADISTFDSQHQWVKYEHKRHNKPRDDKEPPLPQ
jgi:hypothetical protein